MSIEGQWSLFKIPLKDLIRSLGGPPVVIKHTRYFSGRMRRLYVAYGTYWKGDPSDPTQGESSAEIEIRADLHADAADERKTTMLVVGPHASRA